VQTPVTELPVLSVLWHAAPSSAQTSLSHILWQHFSDDALEAAAHRQPNVAKLVQSESDEQEVPEVQVVECMVVGSAVVGECMVGESVTGAGVTAGYSQCLHK
jgi:hypothetical protein